MVHTRELMEQWIIRIENFLGIPAGQVKRIGGGKQIIGGKIGDGFSAIVVQSGA